MQTAYDVHNPLLVSSELILGSLEAASELGADLSESLTVSGIEPAQLVSPSGYLPLHRVVIFLNDAAERFSCAHFGFLVGKHQPPLRFSVLGQLVRFASNLEQAIDDALRFALLNSEYSHWEMIRDGDFAMLVRRTRAYYDAPMVQLQVLAITLVYKALVGLCDRRPEIRRISFTHSAPERKSLFERYFRAPVMFNQEFDGIVLPEACLKIPISTADEAVRSLLAAHLETLGAGYLQDDNIVTKVLHHIKHSLGSSHCNLESISQLLGQNPRTLQRELRKHNITFRQLLSEVRQDLAEQYLRSSAISLVELSDLLGYHNPSAFSRAFKNATALSPEQWKSAQASGDTE